MDIKKQNHSFEETQQQIKFERAYNDYIQQLNNAEKGKINSEVLQKDFNLYMNEIKQYFEEKYLIKDKQTLQIQNNIKGQIHYKTWKHHRIKKQKRHSQRFYDKFMLCTYTEYNIFEKIWLGLKVVPRDFVFLSYFQKLIIQQGIFCKFGDYLSINNNLQSAKQIAQLQKSQIKRTQQKKVKFILLKLIKFINNLLKNQKQNFNQNQFIKFFNTIIETNKSSLVLYQNKIHISKISLQLLKKVTNNTYFIKIYKEFTKYLQQKTMTQIQQYFFAITQSQIKDLLKNFNKKNIFKNIYKEKFFVDSKVFPWTMREVYDCLCLMNQFMLQDYRKNQKKYNFIEIQDIESIIKEANDLYFKQYVFYKEQESSQNAQKSKEKLNK